jgi:hypothetical protein
MIHRRAILGAAALALPALVTGCPPAPTPNTPPNPAPIIADVQSAITALKAQLPAILQAAGASLTPAQKNSITQAVTDANTAAFSLNAATPAAQTATVLQKIDGYLNVILSTAGTLVPPPYGLIIQALALLLPEIEPFVNAALGQPNGTGASAPFPHPQVPDIDSARAVFKKYGS